jgi:GH15 family glucan-1,4-alpha-glucosidase
MALPIEDYALLSDCRSAGLAGRDGSIDWLCFPRFDSAACFAALLGSPDNGRWAIAPQGRYKSARRYQHGTMVLETTFEAAGGRCRLTDCMVVGGAAPTLIRIVEGLEGSVAMSLALTIRFDYGAIVPWVRRLAGRYGLSAVAGPEALLIASPLPLVGRNLQTTARFKVKAGDLLPFTLIWHRSHEPLPRLPAEPVAEVRRTADWWKRWSSQSAYEGIEKAAVQRSLLTLKALTYEPTGGIVAAPTTSLPETLGGRRNWDYRYGWIRDSAFTLQALLLAGYRQEAERWNQWLLRAVAGTPAQMNILYGIGGERRLSELVLPWLSGYEGARPVRVGNAAYEQQQLDIYGELMASSDLGRRAGLPHSADFWRVELKLIEYLAEHWDRPDEGIWEVRGPKRQFTHSKVMAWLGVDRAIKAVQDFGLEGDVRHWRRLRARIHADVCERGFSRKRNSFVQSYGSDELDASLLMIPIWGFLPPGDPRVQGTIAAVERHLMEDGFVLRYRPRRAVDGLSGREGSFLACSFWLANCYSLAGRHGDAEALFQRLSALRNDVGLFSEEYDARRGRLVGNFPQTFSHIGHVVTAGTLSKRCAPIPR